MSLIPNTHIVIYHKNCLDGFGAAIAAKRALEMEGIKNIEFYPLDYSERENFLATVDISNANVHVLDFSFNKIQTDFIKDTCAQLVWLDHHESAFKEHELPFVQGEWVENVDDGHYIKLSANERSGAYLAWKYYIGEVPALICHIDDRDRWQFKLPYTKEICLALSRLPEDFSVWNEFIYNTDHLINRGVILTEYFNGQLNRSIKATRETCNILGREGLCCNLPPMFASEAGNILAKESGTFGATWFKDSGGNIKWSLRSIGDYNVAEMAEQFGGGGHKNAAGFILTPDSGETTPGVKLWRT